MHLWADVLRPLEHHVLEEVGEPCASSAFIGWTDVIPEVDGDQRKAVVLGEDDLEAVLEGVPLKFDLRCGDSGGPAS
jgi:hypothetical protein